MEPLYQLAIFISLFCLILGVIIFMRYRSYQARMAAAGKDLEASASPPQASAPAAAIAPPTIIVTKD